MDLGLGIWLGLWKKKKGWEKKFMIRDVVSKQAIVVVLVPESCTDDIGT